MINEDTPVEAWLQIHYLYNKGRSNIKVRYPDNEFRKNLVKLLSRNDQPYENPYGTSYLVAYPSSS